jgi:DNA-directed RNA polymerase subunit RPC12/RpoP
MSFAPRAFAVRFAYAEAVTYSLDGDTECLGEGGGAMSEDENYAIATREVAEHNLEPASWGRAISSALGDPQVSVALYIRYRVQQLSAAELDRQFRFSREKVLRGDPVRCPRCGHVAELYKDVCGNMLIFLLLSLFLLVPGLLYVLFRAIAPARVYRCQKCREIVHHEE